MSQPIIVKDINSRVYKPSSEDNRIVKFDGANGDIQNSSVYLSDDGSFDSVKGLFLKNRNDGATSTNRFGMYLLDDKVEFTYRDNSNSYLGNAFHININDGTTTFPSKINFNNNIYLENENPIRSVIHRKKLGGGGWAYNPFILQGDDGAKFANIGAYGTENTLGYMFIGPGEWDSDLNLKVFLNGTVKAKSIETTTLSVTDSLIISNATYNKSLSIGHGANDAFWYNSKSGKYVQHKDDGTFSFAGNQILDASNYTNYAAKASHTHSISNITNLQSSLDSKINDSTLFKYMHSDFIVEGNANTYYPVFFPCYGSDSHFTGYTLKIGRMYNEAAPDTWNTATHKGGLTLHIKWSGDYGWGGNGHNFIVEYFEESYCNMVAGIEMCTISFNEGICVWLRGGGALYHAACEYGIPIPKIYYSSFTANNGAVWSPKTSVTNYWWAPYTVTTRYPHNVISTGPNGSFYENYTKGNLSCIQSSTPGNTKMLWAW